MNTSEAIAGAKAAIDTLQGALPLLQALAPAQIGVAIAAVNVVGAAVPVAEKLYADATADTSQDNANLLAAHDAMLDAVAKIDTDAA